MESAVILLFSLAIVFALEGAIVGKFLPTTAIFPAYVVMFDVSLIITTALIILAATAATTGQYFIFCSIKHRNPTSKSNIIREYVYENKWYNKMRKYVSETTPLALLFTNIIPGIRGLLMVPLAETERYNSKTVVSAAFIGNVIHFTLSALLVISGWYMII